MVKMMINADQARKLAEERKTVELDRFLKAVEEAVIATSNIGGHACFVDIKNYDYNLISYAPEVLRNLGYEANFESDCQQTTCLAVRW